MILSDRGLSPASPGISTFRVDGEVKGVTREEIGPKAGEIEKRGPGTVTLEEKNGEYRVTAVAVE